MIWKKSSQGSSPLEQLTKILLFLKLIKFRLELFFSETYPGSNCSYMKAVLWPMLQQTSD